MKIKLPEPEYIGKVSLEECLSKRRSVRKFQDFELTEKQISQLLWSAYGVTDKKNFFKTTPSAGATYPLEIYYVSGKGVFHYLPEEHSVVQILQGDFRGKLAEACLNQDFIKEAGISIVICAVYDRTVLYYGERGYRYVYMEAGHCAQNICLQAIAVGLSSVCVGAFYDQQVKKILAIKGDEEPIYIVVVGKER